MKLRVVASLLSLAIVSVASAQGGRPAGGPPGVGPGGPGGPGVGSGAAPDPSMIVDRMMQGDKNADGKLSKDEVPPPFAERAFERADTNKDGGIDKAELTAFMKSQSEGRGQGGGGEGRGPGAGEGRGPGTGEGRGPGAGEGRQEGRGARGPSFEGGMKQIGRGAKAFEKSTFDAASRDADLEAASIIQAGIATAKAAIAQVKMSEEATKKFGTDEAAFRTELRKQLMASMKHALALEEALLNNNAANAKAALAELEKSESAGHSLFKAD